MDESCTKLRDRIAQWVGKAEQDFDTALHLLASGPRFREAIGFHCQQAAEKYLKALLISRGVEFPKTHDIAHLLELVARFDPSTATALEDADFLTPFGVEMRYPGDLPEFLPGEELGAVARARQVREAVMPLLDQRLEAGESAS